MTSLASSGQDGPRYKCRVGGEWQPLSKFSNRYRKMIQNKRNINPARTGMVCREHSGEPLMELQCEGPCNQTKHLDQFSKKTRDDGVNWCKACQAWATAQEPGKTPFAAPNQLHDVLEQEEDIDIPLAPESYFASSALEDDDDDEADEPLAPVTDSAFLNGPYGDHTSSSSFVATSRTDRSQNLRLPPHVLRTHSVVDSSDGSSDASFPLCLDDQRQTGPTRGLENLTNSIHSMAALSIDEKQMTRPPPRNQYVPASYTNRQVETSQKRPGHPSDVSENSWYGQSLCPYLQGANETARVSNAMMLHDPRTHGLGRGSGRGLGRGSASTGVQHAPNFSGRQRNANRAFSEISEESVPGSIVIKTGRVPQPNTGGFHQGQPRLLHGGSQVSASPTPSSRTGGARFDADTEVDEDAF